jgi:predicted transcriptional regulator/DNA-binding XRE family transcriptional regulator
MPTENSDLDISDAVGERLRHLREQLGLTQVDVAARLGVGQTVVSRIEGRSDLLLSTIRSYLIALGGSLNIRAVLKSGAVFDLDDHGEVSSDVDTSNHRLAFPKLLPSQATGDAIKDVVFSIHPGHASKILTGEKTVELRRRFTEELTPGGLAFIYSTSPTRALTGVAKIHDVQRLKLPDLWKQHRSSFCVRKDDFENYFAGLERGYAIILKSAQPLPRPISLQELRDRCGFAPPQSFRYAPASLRGLVDHERAQGLN